jgi:hypothetical protein
VRSTNEILIAVKENRPVEPEELRLALLVMNAVDHFIRNELDKLIKAVDTAPALAKLRADFARETRERMFQAMKRDPAEWLGPANIPGNPEHDERYRQSIALGKKLGVI